MLLRKNPGWTIAEREATPEPLFFGRRVALAAAGLAGGVCVAGRRCAALEKCPLVSLLGAVPGDL